MSVKYVRMIANFTSEKHLEEFLYRLKLNFPDYRVTRINSQLEEESKVQISIPEELDGSNIQALVLNCGGSNK